MAYTMVNGMRSNRYPLASADCGCGGRSSGMGLDIESAAFGGTVVAASGGLLFGLLTGWWLGKTFGQSRAAVLANRRRRV